MTMNQIKSVASDCGRTHRWAQIFVRPNDSLRIVGIGRTWVRLMFANGKIVLVTPEMINRVW